MITAWAKRPEVIQNLFNPAFCGMLLWQAIHAHNDRGMHYPLTYLVLPMSLHRRIRQSLPSTKRTTLPSWIQSNPELISILPPIAREMVEYTDDALVWALRAGMIELNRSDGRLQAFRRPPKDLGFDDDIAEFSHCVAKAAFLGKWLAEAGSDSTVYALLGIRP